jgi:hypothetical protein
MAMVGDLLDFVSTETLLRIYSRDEFASDKEVQEYLEKVKASKIEKAQEALEGLVVFGIRRTSIDDI